MIDIAALRKGRGEKTVAHKWSERIWTVLATCTQQGHSRLLEFLKKAATNWLNGEEARRRC